MNPRITLRVTALSVSFLALSLAPALASAAPDGFDLLIGRLGKQQRVAKPSEQKLLRKTMGELRILQAGLRDGRAINSEWVSHQDLQTRLAFHKLKRGVDALFKLRGLPAPVTAAPNRTRVEALPRAEYDALQSSIAGLLARTQGPIAVKRGYGWEKTGLEVAMTGPNPPFTLGFTTGPTPEASKLRGGLGPYPLRRGSNQAQLTLSQGMLTRDRDLSLHDSGAGRSFFATVSTMDGKTRLHRRETLSLGGTRQSVKVPAAP